MQTGVKVPQISLSSLGGDTLQELQGPKFLVPEAELRGLVHRRVPGPQGGSDLEAPRLVISKN